jgi:hypothetical protein
MLNFKTQAEEDWYRALNHESGHAAMGILQGIRCYGIFFQQTPIKAVVLTEPLPEPSAMSDGHRLYLASGSASEENTFGSADIAGSREDRKIFGRPQGITFDQKIAEATVILLDKKPRIEKLARRLNEIVSAANGDFSSFRAQRAGMDGNYRDYWELLSEEDLKEELKDI